MIIKNIEKDKPYQLPKDVALNIERTNPFFNEYGEQTLPLTLPPSRYNLSLLGYVNDLGLSTKARTDIPATIQAGNYFSIARQAILGTSEDGISTTFYMNEGAFFSELKKANLHEIFDGVTVEGVTTVAEGIAWCQSLLTNNDPHYALFPIGVKYNDKDYMLNEYTYRVTVEMSEYEYYLAATESRTFKEDDETEVTYSPGFLLSPFIRVKYLLELILKHYGYTLNNSFLDEHEEFKSMVFLNNTMDSLVNGTILLNHLIPSCSCLDVLEVIRKKFCCEFIPNGIDRTVDIKLYQDIVDIQPKYILDDYTSTKPEIDYSNTFRHLVLSSDKSTSDNTNFENLNDIANKYRGIRYNPKLNAYVRTGIGLVRNRSFVVFQESQEIVADYLAYSQDSSLEDYEVKIPDTAVVMKTAEEHISLNTGGRRQLYSNIDSNWAYPYAGGGQWINSKLQYTTTAETVEEIDDEIQSTGATDNGLMFCFSYKDADRPVSFGTISSYNRHGEMLFTHSLNLNGVDGIYEKFYRSFDTALRNSLISVKVDAILPENYKSNLRCTDLVSLKGQSMLVDKFKFSIGDNAQQKLELFTTKSYQSATIAKTEEELLGIWDYAWSPKMVKEEITEEEYNSSTLPNNKEVDTNINFITPPYQSQYEAKTEIKLIKYRAPRSSSRSNDKWDIITVTLIPKKYGEQTTYLVLSH